MAQCYTACGHPTNVLVCRTLTAVVVCMQVFFAYIGFDMVASAAEEARNPRRDVPLATVASVVSCGLLYVAMALVITGMVPYTLVSERGSCERPVTSEVRQCRTVHLSCSSWNCIGHVAVTLQCSSVERCECMSVA